MTDEALAVIVRLCNRKALRTIFPQHVIHDKDWCEAKHPDAKSSFQWCTRHKGHDSPHIDYNLDNETLIWVEGSSKLFRIDEGEMHDNE